jgi:hypothetical protein
MRIKHHLHQLFNSTISANDNLSKINHTFHQKKKKTTPVQVEANKNYEA